MNVELTFSEMLIIGNMVRSQKNMFTDLLKLESEEGILHDQLLERVVALEQIKKKLGIDYG